jgi:hypothetical protein
MVQMKVGEQLAQARTAANTTKTPTAPGEAAVMMAAMGWAARRESERSLRQDAERNAQLGVQSAQIADNAAAEVTAFADPVQVAADTTPPGVSVTSPTGWVSGTVTLSATATDNVGVTGVQFLVNNAPFSSVDTTAPYTLTVNTTPAHNGTYTIAALAGDAAGNITTSAPVTITVFNPLDDNTAPTVHLIGPADGTTVRGTLVLTATATDNVGVTGVQFLVNNTPFSSVDTTAPYTLTVNTTPAHNGTYTLAARATDADGNITTSAPVTITVSNPLDAGSPLFIGDYSTGNLNQWQTLQVVGWNGSPVGYSGYSASVVTDPTRGYVGRFEVRAGDSALGDGNDRAEIRGSTAPNGSVRFYQWSVKFDPGFYSWTNSDWGVVDQWHDSIELAYSGWWDKAPSDTFGFNIKGNGSGARLLTIPMARGTWHDFTMEVKLSTGTDGYIRIWHNGVPQTLLGGSTTWTGQTLLTGKTETYHKEGLYRSPKSQTGIVYHTGFRMATSLANLGGTTSAVV